MYLQKLEELSRFLAAHESSKVEICKFLNFNLFGYLKSRALYFARVGEDGCVHPTENFGFPNGVVEKWGSFSLTVDMPITAAVKRDSLISVNSPAQMYKEFPALKSVENLDHDWQSILAIPIHSYGVYAITSYSFSEIDEVHERFLRTVGQLVTVAFAKCDLIGADVKKFRKQSPRSTKNVLSARQEVILKLILKGLTNVQIGDEIGFSESLVRQESIAIYAALNVSGRKELLENSGGGGG
jgi:DNA-binding CsgD family transcriptional regulator